MDELLPKALPVDGGEVEENVAAAAKWDLPAQSAASYLKMVKKDESIFRYHRSNIFLFTRIY